MSHDKHDKKHKKLEHLIKQRHTRDINQMADVLARGRDLEKEREEEMRAAGLASSRAAAKAGKDGKPVWSAKYQMLRDKNTRREQMAKERWNRFSGTESGGGRGL